MSISDFPTPRYEDIPTLAKFMINKSAQTMMPVGIDFAEGGLAIACPGDVLEAVEVKILLALAA